MMNITLETVNPPDSGKLDLQLKISANIQISSQQAHRLVGVYVGMHVADLLHADSPNLVIRDDGSFWRVPVVLSSKSLGRIGTVGEIDVHVETGELRLTKQTLEKIENNAQRLAIGSAVPHFEQSQDG